MPRLDEPFGVSETPPPKPPRPGVSSANPSDRINTYRLSKSDATWQRQEKIGHGKFGSVWLETRIQNGKPETRAVKEVYKTGNQEVDGELLAFVKLDALEQKDTFARFDGWYETKDSLCFVMEYFEHGDLRRYLGKKPFAEVEALDIARQLLLGLQAMHGEGFVHRDLKLENIFVLQPGPHWKVKIGDFGVSRPLEKAGSSAFTNGVGTAEYMAPEAIPLFEDDDENGANLHAIDIWSVGIILFELLHCRRPFAGKNCLVQLRTYCDSKPWQISGTIVCSGVGEETEILIRKMLRANPKDRPNAMTLHPEVCKQLFELRSGSSATELSGNPAYDPASSEEPPSTHPRSNSRSIESSSVLALRNQFELNDSQPGQRKSTDTRRLGLLLPTLRKAVMNHDIDEFLRLAQPGPAISAVDQKKKTLLHLAVHQRDVRIVEELLRLKAPLDATDIDGHTALHIAGILGEAQITQILVNFGSSVDVPSKSGRTPLFQAIAFRHAAVVQILLHNKAEAAVADFEDVTALHEASRAGYLEGIKLLVEWGADVNASAASGRTPLFEAVVAGDEAVVQYLLDSGADIHLRYHNCETVLHEAAKQGRVSIVQLLVANGADPNAVSITNTDTFSILRNNQSAVMFTTVCFVGLVLLGASVSLATRAQGKAGETIQSTYKRLNNVEKGSTLPKTEEKGEEEEGEEKRVAKNGEVKNDVKGASNKASKLSNERQNAESLRPDPMIKLRSRLGRKPLHDARAYGHIDVVKLLTPITTPTGIEDKFQKFLREQQIGQKIKDILPSQKQIMGLLPDQQRMKGLLPDEQKMKGLVPDPVKVKTFFNEQLKFKELRPDWLANRSKSTPDPRHLDGSFIELEDNEELHPESTDYDTALTQLEPSPLLPPRPSFIQAEPPAPLYPSRPTAERTRAISVPSIPLLDQAAVSRRPKPPVPMKKFKDLSASIAAFPPTQSLQVVDETSSDSPSPDGRIRISMANLPSREALFGDVAGAAAQEARRKEGSGTGVSTWRGR